MSDPTSNYLVARHRVRSYELDSFGHVNNATFLNYLEYARNEYLLQKGLSFSDFDIWHAYPLVVRAEIDYKFPARIHDLLEIYGCVNRWKKTSFDMHYYVKGEPEGKIVLVATMCFVFVNEQGRPVAIPHDFQQKMSTDKEKPVSG